MKKTALLWVFLTLAISLSAQNLTLSGVDSSSLLKNQKVDLYVSVTNDQGDMTDQNLETYFRVFESSDGIDYREVQDKVVEQDTNLREGIHFMMLIDNSGSMYYDPMGKETEKVSEMRISHTGKALENFLNSIQNSRDKISLASFNTQFTMLADNTGKKDTIMEAFGQITKPDEENSYTELYAALTEAGPYLGDSGSGRKVIVVLSDGENYPFAQYSGKTHPEYGDQLYTPQQAIESLQRQGISLYAINYGVGKDPHLQEIVKETGGKIFDASSPEELSGIYEIIRQSLLKELRIRYRAHVFQSDKVWVKVDIPGDSTLPRFYYNSGLFGMVSQIPLWVDLLILCVSIAIWVLLMFIRLEPRRNLPNLEMVGGGLHQRVLDLTKDRTVIGGSNQHDVTIAGMAEQNSESQAATIVYDNKENKYTLIAQADTMVNNQSVKKKDLQNGDVIKVGDSLIIFDGETTKIQG